MPDQFVIFTGYGTIAGSINQAGTIAGYYGDSNFTAHGFVRTSDGKFATFEAPGAGAGQFQGTRPTTNNGEKAVTGWHIDASSRNHGFVWNP